MEVRRILGEWIVSIGGGGYQTALDGIVDEMG